jgi:uncharacterized integral membrane protein
MDFPSFNSTDHRRMAGRGWYSGPGFWIFLILILAVVAVGALFKVRVAFAGVKYAIALVLILLAAAVLGRLLSGRR